MGRIAAVLMVMGLAGSAAACADGEAAGSGAVAGGDGGAAAAIEARVGPGPRELTIRTRDHAFEAPARVPAGATRIRLVNEGPDFHHVWLIRLDPGRTVEELERALLERPVTPEWAEDVGGPNTPGAPGGETSAIVDLEPGLYGLVCMIPGPDGELHIRKGMSRALVVEAVGPEPSLPPAELVLTMDDYGYRMSAPIRAGRRTIRVENVADQAHEVVIVKLKEGKRGEDFLRFLGSREGQAPGEMIAGVTGLARGRSNVITVDFEPGPYAFLCFVHDAEDLKPHFMHGMVHTFQVE